jgi:plasmid stabilization system protein ParE
VDLRLKYTQRALSDLAEIIGHIASDDSDAASHFGSNLLDHLDLLTRFPRMGANVPKRRGVRKLFHSPLLIYYRINQAKGLVEVFHLRHAARKPPRSLG